MRVDRETMSEREREKFRVTERVSESERESKSERKMGGLHGVQAYFKFDWVTFMKNCHKHLQSINRGMLILV